ncbi:MAG: hypothetical protein ABI761_07490 [Saprospiraceae bacterium]
MLDKTVTNNTSFNEEFCTRLEYHLGETFEKSGRQDIKGFWCDGVSWTPILENQLEKKNVNNTRKIVTEAWIGKDGQSDYEMTIHFGKYSLRRYARGNELIDCIPSIETMDWIEIDPVKRTIVVKLK